MKVINNKEIISMIVRFTDLKKKIKNLSEEEEEIKKELKRIMDDFDTKVLIAGEYAATLTERVRRDLNKEKLQGLLGDDYNKFLIKIKYRIFEVKKA